MGTKKVIKKKIMQSVPDNETVHDPDVVFTIITNEALI